MSEDKNLEIAKEYEQIGPAIYNLEHLIPAQIEDLSKIITAQKGKVRWFIHPFYDYGSKNPFEILDETTSPDPNKRVLVKAEFKSTERYLNGLKRLIQANPPILFLGETERALDNTTKVIRSLGYKNPIAYYTTQRSNSPPNATGNFDMLSQVVASVGVQSIIVGGKYMQFRQYNESLDPDSLPIVYRVPVASQPIDLTQQGYSPAICVGNFVNGMSKYGKFDITVSGISEPEPFPSKSSLAS